MYYIKFKNIQNSELFMDLQIVVGVCTHENDNTEPRVVIMADGRELGMGAGDGLSPASVVLNLSNGNSCFVISFPLFVCRLEVFHNTCVYSRTVG